MDGWVRGGIGGGGAAQYSTESDRYVHPQPHSVMGLFQADSKGPDQTAHPRSLIWDFTVRIRLHDIFFSLGEIYVLRYHIHVYWVFLAWKCQRRFALCFK